MVKYHVNLQGRTTLCRANIRLCPYGEENHFETKEEAVAFAKERFQREFETLPVINNVEQEPLVEPITTFQSTSDLEREQEYAQGFPIINPVGPLTVEQRIEKAKQGLDVETLAKDKSSKVRLELAKRGLASDTLSKDDNYLVSRYGAASVGAKEVAISYEGYGKNNDSVVVFVYDDNKIKIMTDSIEVNSLKDFEEVMDFDRSYYKATSKLEMKKIKRSIEKILEKHNYQQ